MIFSWPGEDLFEHGRDVALIGECLFPEETRYYNALLNELENRDINWWRVAAALHDIGKAHKKFQATIGRKPSFICHELLSALYIWEALEASPKIRAAVALTVLLHHHAMDRFERCIKSVKGFETADGFTDYVSRFSKWLGVGIRPIENITADIGALKRWIDQRIYRIAVIGVGPIAVADHVAAARRGGYSSRLLEELKHEIGGRLEKCKAI
jgi:CRISPR-associated endonuclease Cas3-HD